jgi:hypothetical protein
MELNKYCKEKLNFLMKKKKHWMQPMQQKDVKDSLVKRLKLNLYQIPIKK